MITGETGDIITGETGGGGTLRTWTVPANAAGERVDKALAVALVDLSRSRLRALLDQGHVRRSDVTITDPATLVKAGQTFIVFLPDPAPAEPEPQAIALTIVYEDEEVLVVDKAAGMVVHPAPGSPDKTLVNALLAHCGDLLSGIGGVRRPGIVHRLDKDTSGLMVVAKSDRAHAGLASQFEDRTIRRTYTAVVWGLPTPPEGVIKGNIGRSSADRKKMAVVTHGGKTAATSYRVIRDFGAAASQIECRLETGRTHQIRVHLASVRHPLIGDPVYGRNRTSGRPRRLPESLHAWLLSFPRQALHAHRLVFTHPTSGAPMSFDSVLPDDIANLISRLDVI
ncbi:MAG: RluA family pseudouridine synthase [Rhodospirillaceae bacterium]